RAAEQELPMRGERLEDLRERNEREGAHDRTVERTDAAEDKHQQTVPRLMPRKELRVNETELQGGKITRQAGERPREREACELVAIDREAQRAHPMLVAADSSQRVTERRGQTHAQQDESDHQPPENEIVEVRWIAEVERSSATDRRGRLEVHRDSIGAAAELRVVKDEIEHLRQGKSHHDEVDAF